MINNTGMELLVNNAWSGSTVFEDSNGQGNNAITYNTDRPINLHDNTDDPTYANGTTPDVIAMYIGINDFNTNNSKLGTFDSSAIDALITDNGDGTYTYGTASSIIEAYAITVHRMTVRYEDSDIFLFTMLPNTWYKGKGVSEERLVEFNTAIKAIANKFGVDVVDLYSDTGITADNQAEYLIDGLHPNAKGMDLITACVERALYAKYM